MYIRRSLVVLVATVASVCSALPASAEVVTKWDPHPKCSQAPALDVRRATFDYATDRFEWRVKMAKLSKKRTRVIARYTLGNRNEDRYDVLLVTRYDAQGEQRTVGFWSDYTTGQYSVRFTDGLSATWDWTRDIITFVLTSHLKGHHADAWAYSIAKGRQEGPACGDYIWSGRIDRG